MLMTDSGNFKPKDLTKSAVWLSTFKTPFRVRQVQSRDIWDVLVLSFSFFFLQLERDTSNWTLLDSSHQVSSVTSDLVSQSLGLDSSDFVTQSLVGLEIHGQLWIVTFDQSLGGTLDGLGSNSTL